MKCLEDGQILLYLENELDPDESARIAKHLENCELCSRRFEALKQDLLFTTDKLVPLFAQTQTEAVRGQEKTWQYLRERCLVRKREESKMKFKKYAAAAAVVVMLGVMFTVPSVQTVAAKFLQSFRMEKVDVVTLSPQDMQQIENAIMDGNESFDLDEYGKIEVVGDSEYKSLEKGDLNELDISVRLPENLEEDASFELDSMGTVEITPNVAKVNQLLEAMGSDYVLPEGLDGETCRIIIGDMLQITTDDYCLMQCEAPVIEVPEGVNVNEVAAALVQLPIWPQDVQRQLASISDWEHTMVLPMEENKGEKVMVNGTEAVLLDKEWCPSLIWQEDGMFYVIDTFSDAEIDVISLAESLR